jgi:hypothetical protein
MEYVLPLGTKFLDRLRITADELREDRGLSESTKINISRLKSRFWALNYDQWIQLYRRIGSTYIDKPDIPSLHLNKVDRGGALVKALALIQVSYLIIQLISRKIGGLPSTQLEIATLAFAVCSLITYLLYWSRPQEVQTIHIIKAKELIPNDPRDPFKLKDILKTTGQSGPVYLWLSPRLEPEYPDDGPTPIPNDASSQVPVFSIFWSLEVNYEILTLASGALFGGTIFGGLHCLAWNFHFPTPEEALGWRICSIATTVLPVLSLGPIIAWMRLNPYSEKKRGGSAMRAIVASIGLGFCMLPYALARLYLLVEVFRTLCFAPPEVFVDTWSGSFPHIGG